MLWWPPDVSTSGGGSSSEQVSTGLQVSLAGAGHGRSHVCCCLGRGGRGWSDVQGFYIEVQCIMGYGHMGTSPCAGQTHMKTLPSRNLVWGGGGQSVKKSGKEFIIS